MKENFNTMKLSPEVVKGIAKMGFQSPTQVQASTIEPFLQQKDLIVQAPTGTGKTGAFAIPVIEMAQAQNREINTIVLCPTRELALQITGVFQGLSRYKPGVKVQAIYGGESFQKQISALRSKPQIIVATPGRLLDHIRKGTIRLSAVTQVILDEADRMLDMGFRQDINAILQATPAQRQTIFFSATLSPDVKRTASLYQSNAENIKVALDNASKQNISHYYTQANSNTKNPILLKILNDPQIALSVVFVPTKSMADHLSSYLNKEGFQTAALHGDLRQNQRNDVIKKFRRGQINTLIATDVAARGIDINDIDAVINYGIPNDADSYIHRVGRTGRAGSSGTAYTLISSSDYGKLANLERKTKFKIKLMRPEQYHSLPIGC